MKSDWLGIRVRRGDQYGRVIRDENGYYRALTIKMDNSDETQMIVMNNIGADPEKTKEWEWQPDPEDATKWYRF